MAAHGLMFHYFHDGERHIRGQGSITADEFAAVLDRYDRANRILSADVWLDKAIGNRLGERDVCVTFDDGLRCQFDIALPVLESMGIRAFWFVYSSPLERTIERIELYRYFRFTKFKRVEDFYKVFSRALRTSPYIDEVAAALKVFRPARYLKEFSFYTPEDRRFRYLRDIVLGRKRYCEVMDKMIEDSHFCVDETLLGLLWLDEHCIRKLREKSNLVGLHSHTHPTMLASLSYAEQRAEYEKNYAVLKTLLAGQSISTMSHPCNSYNESTLRIISDLGIKIGFRSNMCKMPHSMLEFPRLDNAYLMRRDTV